VITGLLLQDIEEELSTREIKVHFAPEIPAWLLAQTPKQGSARILRSVIRTQIEDPLSLALLRNQETSISVELKDGQLVFDEEALSVV
jgi:ATP-dependent Clp protease ATP-binding subunit ClpC